MGWIWIGWVWMGWKYLCWAILWAPLCGDKNHFHTFLVVAHKTISTKSFVGAADNAVTRDMFNLRQICYDAAINLRCRIRLNMRLTPITRQNRICWWGLKNVLGKVAGKKNPEKVSSQSVTISHHQASWGISHHQLSVTINQRKSFTFTFWSEVVM